MQVLKIYNANNEYIDTLRQFTGVQITERINQLNELIFYVPKLDNLMEEGVVETPSDFYTIKAIDTLVNGYKITCEQNVDGLRETYLSDNRYETMSIQRLMTEMLAESTWDFKDYTQEINFKRTIESEGHNAFSILPLVVKTYEVELLYNTKEKIIEIYNQVGDKTGAYFDSELNITSSALTSDTFEFYTRIIPEGADGLTIEEINDGKPYIDNNKYSNKVITYYWKDERYTIVENLKEDAKRKLEKMARPYSVIDIQVKDLSHTEKYKFLHASLGDTVIVNDKRLQIKDEFRIIEKTTFIDNPEETVIILSNINESFLSLLENDLKGELEELQEVTKGKMDIIQDQMDELQVSMDIDIDEQLKEFEDKFNAELAKAPEVTLEWLNKNTGVLDGDVLAINSIKTKHLQSGSITAEKIEAGAIKGKHITADAAFIDKISSNLLVSDLIMAGKIEGNNSFWDLDKGDFVLGDKLKFIDDELIIKLSGNKTVEEFIEEHIISLESEFKQTTDSLSASINSQGEELAGIHVSVDDMAKGNIVLNGNTSVKGDFVLTSYDSKNNSKVTIETGKIMMEHNEKMKSEEYYDFYGWAKYIKTETGHEVRMVVNKDSYFIDLIDHEGSTPRASIGIISSGRTPRLSFGDIELTGTHIRRIEDRISALERGR